MGIMGGRKIQILLKKMNINNNNHKGYTLLHHQHRDTSNDVVRKQKVSSGHFPIYVGEELKRYVIPVAYLSSKTMQDLLNKFEDEIQGGGSMVLPCSTNAFEEVLNFAEVEIKKSRL